MVFFKSMIFKLIKFLDSKINYEFQINLNLKIHHGLIQVKFGICLHHWIFGEEGNM